MEESPKILFKLPVIKNLVSQQLGDGIKRSLSNYYSLLNSLQNIKPTTALENYPVVPNKQMSELQFNSKGNLIANAYWGNDSIQIHDWFLHKRKAYFNSGHNHTVRQVNWVPADPENLVVTSGQYGDIRLMDLTTNKSRVLENSYSKLKDEEHFSGGFKFCVNSNLPYTVLAGSQKGKIIHIDIRDSNSMELVVAKHNSSTVFEICGIDINPAKCSEFCIGDMKDLRLYDCRNLTDPVHKLIVDESPTPRRILTVKYNYNGTEILAAYSDDPVYLFNTLRTHPIKTYEFQKSPNVEYSFSLYNVHFIGSRSDFIVASASMNSNLAGRTVANNLYIWDKDTERLVHETSLEERSCRFAPHPYKPILAMNLDTHGIRLWQ